MSTTEELWKEYQQRYYQLSAWDLVLGTAGFDGQTIAPKAGAAYRDQRLTSLSGQLFALRTDPQYLSLLEELSSRPDLTFEQKRIVSWERRDLQKLTCLPREFYEQYQQTASESYLAWEKAKQTDDYSLYAPYLEQIVALTRQMLEYRKGAVSGYDILLDDFEPGMTVQQYDAFFDLVKAELVPLIQAIGKKPAIDDGFRTRFYPKHEQELMARRILEYMRMDPQWCCLTTTEHPFSQFMSRQDVRVTTHYYENDVMSSIFSVIHESGHATFNHQIREDLAETYCFDNMSSGLHESQSRLAENYLGRRASFWDNLFEPLKQLFPEQLADVDQEKFVKAANRVQPSLVRTEADELTYPLHILIRYELEKELFLDGLEASQLEERWNEKYRQYLGVSAEKPSQGILQDVHWSGGSFGYFPTYALGSGYAAQFMQAMEKDLDVDAALSGDHYERIQDWLREHIHQFGGLYSPSEVMKIATGRPFDPHSYTDYLKQKYTALYQL